jgi:hypothetical protein
MPDWYRDHDLSPEAYPESEYLGWVQDQGLHVDAAGNVDYGPPEGTGDEPAFYPGPGFAGDTRTYQPRLCNCWDDDDESED